MSERGERGPSPWDARLFGGTKEPQGSKEPVNARILPVITVTPDDIRNVEARVGILFGQVNQAKAVRPSSANEMYAKALERCQHDIHAARVVSSQVVPASSPKERSVEFPSRDTVVEKNVNITFRK